MVRQEGLRNKNPGETKRAPLPTTYFATVDFDVPLPEFKHPAKEVLIFGFDTRGDNPPVLTPFPIKATRMNERERQDAAKNLTRVVKREYKDHLHIRRALRFLPLKDMAPALTTPMLSEIGYALLTLAENPETAKGASEKFSSALWNTGAMFLLSAGADGPMEGKQKEDMVQLYDEHYAPILGNRPPWILKNSHVRLVDAFVQATKDAVSMQVAFPLDEIAEFGHAFTYVLQRIGNNKGHSEIVIGPNAPPNYGTPVGAYWFALQAS